MDQFCAKPLRERCHESIGKRKLVGCLQLSGGATQHVIGVMLLDGQGFKFSKPFLGDLLSLFLESNVLDFGETDKGRVQLDASSNGGVDKGLHLICSGLISGQRQEGRCVEDHELRHGDAPWPVPTASWPAVLCLG